MRHKDAERLVFRSADGPLAPPARRELDAHLAGCARCRRFAAGARIALEGLRIRPGSEPELLPRFWERLEARLAGLDAAVPAAVWLRWSRRMIPVSLGLILAFAGATVFFEPSSDEWTAAEALLLRDANPLAETQTYLAEGPAESRGTMILFAADVKAPSRSPQP